MRWVARAMLRVCAAVEALVPLCITAAPVSSSAQTPAWCPSNAPRCRSTAVQPQIFHISDEYAKQYAVKHLGPDVVAHMQVRVGENTQLTSSSSTGTQAFTSYVDEYNGAWSGYVSDLSGSSKLVSTVTGTFIVAACTSCSKFGEWVGIGGYHGSKNLIQIGIDQQTLQGWFECWPAAAVYINGFYAQNNDSVIGFIQFDTSTRKWYIELDDYDSNKYYSSEVQFNPDQTTADWIEEDVSGALIPSVMPTIYFSVSWWEDTNTSASRAINDSEVVSVRKEKLDPAGSRGVCLLPSSLGSGGESFSINRNAGC